VHGLLLVNLGTPDEPTPGAVRRYLREFLSDPRVLDINPVGRALLLELVILPFRPARSAEAYRKIWTERGSPLLFHGQDLARAAADRLGDGWAVELAMRYGRPSIPAALDRLRDAGVSEIVVFPLYPHSASSSSGSSLEAIYRAAAERWNVPPLRVVPPFFAEPGYIEAFARVGEPALAALGADHVLFSYHGLPERHMRKSDYSGRHCLATGGCCDALGVANRDCYRAQCYATTRALVGRLGLAEGGYSTSFQSRLGRTPWIKPYTDVVLRELAGQGVRRLAVFSPAFVADCLETLEELALRARDDFRAAGGEELALIPSLNATPAWVDCVVDLARRQASRLRTAPPAAALGAAS
jgi:protoporphyrin/coproporphyrin ferrochelatase